MNQPLQYILIFDADNTLWDTNAVFYSAQVAMLATFELNGHLIDSEDKVTELREMDKLLMQLLGLNEYNFELLCAAVAYRYVDGLDFKLAVEAALKNNVFEKQRKILINEALRKYQETLIHIPPLLPNVTELLSKIRAYKNTDIEIVSILFSEGDSVRVERAVVSHSILKEGLLNDIFIGPKNKKSFEKAKNLGENYLTKTLVSDPVTIVIGDSLKRDIRPAKEAGFITVYIPGGFQGRETPQTEKEHPDFQIDNISQLPKVLNKIGLLIEE